MHGPNVYCFLFDALRKTEAGNFEHSPGDWVALLPMVLAFWNGFRGPTAKTVRDVVTRNSAEPEPCSLLLQPRSKSLIIFKQATRTGLASLRIQEEQGSKNLLCRHEDLSSNLRNLHKSQEQRCITLVFLQGSRSYRQAHRQASLEYTEGIRQQRDPASNKIDSEDQLLRLSPGLHTHTVEHTCPHSPT